MQESGTVSTPEPEGALPLVSLVWVQRKAIGGLFQPQDPGLLIAREGGRISLMTLQEKLFEAEKHAIGASWPWYQFGQGARLNVGNQTYRFAWMPGNSTSRVWDTRRRTEVVSTLAGREGLSFTQLAPAKVWRSYLKA